MLVGQSHLQGGEILPLDVLHKRHLHHVLVIHSADVGRHALQAGHLTSPPAALSGNDGIESVARITQGDGLHDAYLRDAVGQFAQAFLIEFPAWLIGVGLDEHHIHLAYVRRAACVHLAGVQQCVQASAQCRSAIFPSYSHVYCL